MPFPCHSFQLSHLSTDKAKFDLKVMPLENTPSPPLFPVPSNNMVNVQTHEVEVTLLQLNIGTEFMYVM